MAEAFLRNWSMPKQISTRCPECDGDGVVVVTCAYLDGDVMRSIRAPQTCKGCRGKGRFPGLQPPV